MNLLDGVGNLVLQQLQAPTHVRPVWPFTSFQWLKCWQLSNQPISGQSAHNIKLFGILIFSSAMIVVSAIQFLDVTKTESGTSVDREIYWVTYLLGKCLGRCSTFFGLKYVVNIVRYIGNIVNIVNIVRYNIFPSEIFWILWEVLWTLWDILGYSSAGTVPQSSSLFFRLKSCEYCEICCEYCEV